LARIRSVKPEYWDDRKLAKRASRDARLLYIALWNLADEWGRLNGDPQWIKGQVFSYDDDLNADSVAKLLEELENPALGAVIAYEVDGDPYLFLPKLGKHQRLEPEKVKSRLPAPPDPDGCGPNPPPSERGSDESASRADSSERGADEIAPDANESERGADKPALLYVAGGREHVAGGRDARDAPSPRRGTPAANRLLDEHISACAAKPPRPVAAKVGEAIDVLLDDPDIKPDEIREGLRRLRAKPHLGPGVLASLVNEYRQEQADPSLTQRGSPKRDYSRGGAGDPLTNEDYSKGAIL
jgi:hypothetical protein